MLEQKIEALTQAILALTETIKRIDGPTVDAAPKAKTPKVKETPKVEETKVEETPKVEETKVEETPSVEETPKVATTSAKYTLQSVRDVAQKCLDAGKLADVVAINKAFGLKRIGEANPEQWPEIVKKLQAALDNG